MATIVFHVLNVILLECLFILQHHFDFKRGVLYAASFVFQLALLHLQIPFSCSLANNCTHIADAIHMPPHQPCKHLLVQSCIFRFVFLANMLFLLLFYFTCLCRQKIFLSSLSLILYLSIYIHISLSIYIHTYINSYML